MQKNIKAHSTQHTAHSTQHTAHSTQHTAHSTQHTAHNKTCLLIAILLFSALLISLHPKAQEPPKPTVKSVSPDPSTHFCPLPFNFNQISFEFENVTSSEVEFVNPTNLSIANLAQTSASVLRGDFSFSDQWQAPATVQLRIKQNSSHYWKGLVFGNYTFPNVRSLLTRNIFDAAPNSKTIIAPICPTTVNIKFDKIKYVRLGGKADNNNDLFSEVSSYEYLLPAGVTPLSGLTPAPGLPNTYTGNNDVFVTVTHPFNNLTIQVRATNTFCSQAVKGNFNNIFIQRQLPTLNGPNSIRCGETDTKTFQVVNLPTSNNCITTYTWQIANKG